MKDSCNIGQGGTNYAERKEKEGVFKTCNLY